MRTQLIGQGLWSGVHHVLSPGWSSWLCQRRTAVPEPASTQDACTQTPSRARKRRGGGGSRFRRLLAHQLMLSERWGLPLSKLLLRSKMKTEAKSSKVVLQKVKEELIKEEVEVKVKEEKVMPCSAGASTGGQTLFTPRSNQPEKVNQTPTPALQCPDTPPFSNFSSPFYTHNNTSPTTYISHPQHFSQSTLHHPTPRPSSFLHLAAA